MWSIDAIKFKYGSQKTGTAFAELMNVVLNTFVEVMK